jgi:hypothetical protein
MSDADEPKNSFCPPKPLKKRPRLQTAQPPISDVQPTEPFVTLNPDSVKSAEGATAETVDLQQVAKALQGMRFKAIDHA